MTQEQTVLYFKLVNGDEMFGVVSDEDTHSMTVNNPMTTETRYSADGTSAVVVNRYVPYLHKHSIKLNKHSVMFAEPVHPMIDEYYKLSVEYAHSLDSELIQNVKIAMDYMRKVMGLMSNVKTEEDKKQVDSLLTDILTTVKTQGSAH